LKLETLSLLEDFPIYFRTFLDDYSLEPDVFKYAHYIYLMGVCADTGEIIENIESEDPFEKKKREKMMRGQSLTENNNSIMDTVAIMCMGDNRQNYNVILDMNLIEIKGINEAQERVLKNSKPKGNKTDIEDMSIPKMN